MNDKATAIRSWGIGLMLIALILPVLGIFGAGFMEDRHDKIRNMRAMQEWEARERLMATHEEALRNELGLLSDLPLEERWEMATGPVVKIPPQVVGKLRESADGYLEDLLAKFPDLDHVVRIEIGFDSPKVSTDPRFVSARSPELPPEAAVYPDRFRLWGEEGSEPIRISLMLADGDRPGTNSVDSQRWHANYARDEILQDRQAISGGRGFNMVIAGVRARAVLQAFTSERAGTITPYVTLGGLFDILGVIGLVLLVLIPPVWVYVDARVRRQPALLWLLFTLPTSVLGALIYALVTRDSGRACPECGEQVAPRYVVCPYCQTELKGSCPNCGQTVGHDWTYCPSCATEI